MENTVSINQEFNINTFNELCSFAEKHSESMEVIDNSYKKLIVNFVKEIVYKLGKITNTEIRLAENTQGGFWVLSEKKIIGIIEYADNIIFKPIVSKEYLIKKLNEFKDE